MLLAPLSLLPLQILWINLVTDGLPGPALSAEPPERDTMRRPLYHTQESIFGGGLGAVLLTFVLQMAAVYVPFPQNLFKTNALLSYWSAWS